MIYYVTGAGTEVDVITLPTDLDQALKHGHNRICFDHLQTQVSMFNLQEITFACRVKRP